MKKQTIEEWTAEGESLFGNNPVNWKFVCPACGRINTGGEFKEHGAGPNDMYQTCIGRHNGNMRPADEKARNDGQGCDWTASGLFGVLGKGRIVVTADGEEVEVFNFASNETIEGIGANEAH